MKAKKILFVVALILLFLSLTNCAPNNERFVASPAGFWAGLWHGAICCITFIISLFTDKVTIYEVNNTGSWYNFGFILGILLFVKGCDNSKSSKKKKKEGKKPHVNWKKGEGTPGSVSFSVKFSSGESQEKGPKAESSEEGVSKASFSVEQEDEGQKEQETPKPNTDSPSDEK